MAPAHVRAPARRGGVSPPERRASIFVVGPEGSGTTVLWRCLAAHPDLRGMTAKEAPTPRQPLPATGLLLHLSLPTLRPMRWVDPDELPQGVTVVTMRRSAVHTVYSAYRRFYRDPAAAWRAYLRAVELEARYIAERDPICVCYEDLTANSAKVLRRLYESIGVRSDFHPPVELRDRNDGRWRADASFRMFMQTAFGSIGSRESSRGERPRRQRKSDAPATPPYVCIRDVLGRDEYARIVAGARTPLGRTRPRRAVAARSQTSREVWRRLEDRVRQVFPYVRRELGLPWLPLVRIERRAADAGRRSTRAPGRAPSEAGRHVTCIYSFDAEPGPCGRRLRLYAAGAASAAPVCIERADNAAVFFVGNAYRQEGGRPISGIGSSSITMSLRLGAKPRTLDAALSPPSAGVSKAGRSPAQPPSRTSSRH